MPYVTGQDIGGFGRLAEMNLRIAGERRKDAAEMRAAKLNELQMQATQSNMAEVQRAKQFQQTFSSSIMQAKPGDHFRAGMEWLQKEAESNPANADLAYKQMHDLRNIQAGLVSKISNVDPKAAHQLWNNTIGAFYGISMSADPIKKGDLKLREIFDNETGEFKETVQETNEGFKHYSNYRITEPKKKEGTAEKAGAMVKGEDDLRKEFNGLPETKTYTEVSRQIEILGAAMESVRESAGKPDESRSLIAVDQALITLFNKMMDPTSVVRESEYARTPGDMAMMSRAKGAFKKVTEGGAGLTDPEREAIYSMAKKFGQVAEQKYVSQSDFYSNVADRRGYNTENIIRIKPKGEKFWEDGGAEKPQSMTVEYDGMDVNAKLAADGNYYIRRGNKYLKYIPEAE